jgi:SAM-dependent methyltransferase
MSSMTFTERALTVARNIHSREAYMSMRKYVRGHVLDVGGWDFYLTARKQDLSFDRWTTLENEPKRALDFSDPKFEMVIGDGCHMNFRSDHFDTILNIQVLEHVYDPIRMVHEIARVLKPGGKAIFLIPQTGTLHMAPHHYYNFTRYWIEETMRRSNLEIVEVTPLGGVWSTIAARLIYFFLTALRVQGRSHTECKRNLLFYILFPLMVVYALVNIPITLLLSLGDLTEEANNHLVVARKPL